MTGFTKDDLRVLLARRDRILTRLQTISDAPTGVALSERTQYKTRHRAAKTSHHGESAPPRDATLSDDRAGSSHAPSKRFSLYAHYRWRFERATDVPTLMQLCAIAERDYLEYIGVWRRPSFADHEQAVNDLLDHWRGCEDREVALHLDCQIKWVRKHRAMNGWEPTFGDERLRVDERTARILKMAGDGASSRAIGVEVGLSHAQVQRVLASV